MGGASRIVTGLSRCHILVGAANRKLSPSCIPVIRASARPGKAGLKSGLQK